jgi:hypothetical protein
VSTSPVYHDAFIFPLGFSGEKTALMTQLEVRHLAIFLVNETWSTRIPCQIVFYPSNKKFETLTEIMKAPLVPFDKFQQDIGYSKTRVSYTIAVSNVPAPTSPNVQYVVFDIGTTLNYVPLQNGDEKITQDIWVPVTGAQAELKLPQQDTLPIDSVLSVQNMFADKVILVGNRSLNGLVLEVNLDDGPTGTLRLLRGIEN